MVLYVLVSDGAPALVPFKLHNFSTRWGDEGLLPIYHTQYALAMGNQYWPNLIISMMCDCSASRRLSRLTVDCSPWQPAGGLAEQLHHFYDVASASPTLIRYGKGQIVPLIIINDARAKIRASLSDEFVNPCRSWPSHCPIDATERGGAVLLRPSHLIQPPRGLMYLKRQSLCGFASFRPQRRTPPPAAPCAARPPPPTHPASPGRSAAASRASPSHTHSARGLHP
jgi:hypothetical protein